MATFSDLEALAFIVKTETNIVVPRAKYAEIVTAVERDKEKSPNRRLFVLLLSHFHQHVPIADPRARYDKLENAYIKFANKLPATVVRQVTKIDLRRFGIKVDVDSLKTGNKKAENITEFCERLKLEESLVKESIALYNKVSSVLEKKHAYKPLNIMGACVYQVLRATDVKGWSNKIANEAGCCYETMKNLKKEIEKILSPTNNETSSSESLVSSGSSVALGENSQKRGNEEADTSTPISYQWNKKQRHDERQDDIEGETEKSLPKPERPSFSINSILGKKS